jgi:NAD(P)-dependent dehydrogenase (short-subunit alcohol dehydrogenase family)
VVVLAARTLAQKGHIVYPSMRETTGRNSPQVKEVEVYAAVHGVDLHAIELNVLSQISTYAAVKTIISEIGRLDVVIHNAGDMVFGPAVASTNETHLDDNYSFSQIFLGHPSFLAGSVGGWINGHILPTNGGFV